MPARSPVATWHSSLCPLLAPPPANRVQTHRPMRAQALSRQQQQRGRLRLKRLVPTIKQRHARIYHVVRSRVGYARDAV